MANRNTENTTVTGCKIPFKGLNPIELVYAGYAQEENLKSGCLNEGNHNKNFYKMNGNKYVSYRHKSLPTEKRALLEQLLNGTIELGDEEDAIYSSNVNIIYFRDISKNNEHILVKALQEKPLVEESIWERWSIVNNSIILSPHQTEKLIQKMITLKDESLKEENEYLDNLLN